MLVVRESKTGEEAGKLCRCGQSCRTRCSMSGFVRLVAKICVSRRRNKKSYNQGVGRYHYVQYLHVFTT